MCSVQPDIAQQLLAPGISKAIVALIEEET